MSHRDSILSQALRSPIWVWAVVLLIVFAVETGVMIALSLLEQNSISKTAEVFIDAVLLTLISAPLLWWVIIAPLRRIAIREFERSQTIVSNAGEGILTFNQDGIVLSCNHAGAKLFSIDSVEAIGKSIHSWIPDLVWNQQQGAREHRLNGSNSVGDTVPLLVSISALPAENSMIALIRDLTETERSQQQRIESVRENEALRAQQMATLAQLATGVAHEIRNPLTSIKMMIQVNRDKFAASGLPTEDMDLVEQEIRRMERSVNSLLEYARPEQAEFVEFELQAVVEKMARLISGQCSAQNVTLNLQVPPAPLRICGDPSQIQQLLLNLSLNGMDAMPTGGTLVIMAEVEPSKATITVTDTGHGIRDDVLDKLFSPFVTTKPNGVGLGLGICRRIAEGHAGQLTGSNIDSGGAQFKCILPLVAQPAPKFAEAN